MKLGFVEWISVKSEDLEEDGIEAQLVLRFEGVDEAGVTIPRLVIPQTDSLLQLRLPNAVRHRRLTI